MQQCCIMKSKLPLYLVGLIIVVGVVALAIGATKSHKQIDTGANSSQVIQVVAAENFYGDIVKQLGGSHVQVKSILSDPNVDPHEYESNVQDGIAISKANFVIKNGDDYDTWIDKLLSASPN